MSDDMNEDSLRRLSRSPVPEPSAASRDRAIDAALLAFDAARPAEAKTTQGTVSGPRLTSIFQLFRGNWIMDTRYSLGFGTAALALLLLPLGYQLYTSTAITPPGFMADESAPEAAVETEPEKLVTRIDPASPAGRQTVLAEEPAGTSNLSRQQLAQPPAPAPGLAATRSTQSFVPMRDEILMPAPAASGDAFTGFEESPVKVVAEEPVSTFSIDVDTAAYSYVRRMLNDGILPSPDAVRIEEMINYFDYDYDVPDSAGTPFQPTMSIYPTPWNPQTQLLQIGIKGYVPPTTENTASNLVFLLDTSGSMDAPDKLPLLKRAFMLLADQLGADDTVSIVAYAGSAGVVLEPTKANETARIIAALDSLGAGGSTAGADGIELAYQLAARNMIEGGINRVILATDGDFNVGIDDPDELVDFIRTKRDEGISLSVLGFGTGNLGDDTMQALAQNGNGNASYIDSFREARKVLVEEMDGTLQTIAQDVKIQVEFNPAVVAEYRLVGYETRALNRQDFNNDRVDAGDIGAGHTVTALYEITPAGSGAELIDPLRYGSGTPSSSAGSADEIGYLKMRYKLPGDTESVLTEAPITDALVVDSLEAASTDARWAAAVAAFAQKLKGSVYAGDISYEQIRELAQDARGEDERGYRAEFIQLINAAATLDRRD